MNAIETNKIKIWLFTKEQYVELLSEEEKCYLKHFNQSRARQYSYSRTSLRKALSSLFKINPLKVPIFAPPGRQPILKSDLGFISISHCKDALLIGWSISPIGIDIENSNRVIKSNKIFRKILNDSELKEISPKNEKDNIRRLLKKWVIKEAIVKKEAQSLITNAKDWEWRLQERIAYNKKQNKKTIVVQDNILGWEIGLACDELKNKTPIICLD